MQYVLLIAPSPFDRERLHGVAPNIVEILTSQNEDFLLRSVEFDQNIRLVSLGADCEDWSDKPSQVADIEAVGPAREIYAVHFKDVERLKTVLRGLVSGGGFILDDDYGLFVTGEEFVRLDDANPGLNHWWLGGNYQ
jgi:hypothetical protein